MKKSNLIKTIACAFLLTGVFSSIAISSRNKDTEQAQAAEYTQSITDYYSSINWDQTGATLKTSLFNKIKITTAGWSYDGLWDAYRLGDVRPDGLHFWDIYSDTTMYTLNDKRINASYKKEGDSINREHVIPQSTFNEAAPMKSDFHHVLPSDGYVNNRRSAYPHGIVSGSATYTSNDGCKLGSGTGSTTVFEPMDQYKGDIARIYFYFVTCYQDKMSSNSFSVFDKSTYPSIKSAYLNVYLQWAKDDPVSQKEIDRNNVGYGGQGNRNPFVDCPYAVGAIWDPDHATDYGNKGEYTSGEGMTISKTTASLISGNTTTISATTTDSSNITWSTSNSSVVSLSSTSSGSGSNITLTAGNAGTATITASATINSKQFSKTCTVTVSATKQVSSIELSGNYKISFAIDDDFVFGGTVTAYFNDDTSENVTESASFAGYNMSVAGSYTVTASYTYGDVTKTASYEITVSASGGSTDINDYDVSSTPLSSSGITTGMKVAWGTSPTNLAKSIGSNWVYLSTTRSEWLVFTLEGTSSGFTLKAEDGYVYSSGDKKVSFDSTNGTTLTLRADNLVTGSSCGTFYFNSSGLRPYNSGSYTNAYLYPLTLKKTLTSIDVQTFPTKVNYEVGEYFDPTGLVITREYSDSSTDTYAYAGHTTEFTFDPSTSTPLTIDHETVEIIYGGQSCFFDIEVSNPLVLESIAISGYQTSFIEGDTFTYGGTVIANFENGSVFDVTADATITGYDMATTGQQTVTVSYTRSTITKTATYNITVNKGTLSSIAVSGQTTTFHKNGTFVFDGTCTATFANGYQKVVTPTSVTSPDMSTAGNKTITVSYTYNGVTKTTEYQITVNSYRAVYEITESVLGTVVYTSGSEVITNNSGLTTSKSGYTGIENGPDTSHKALRLGSGSNTGTLTITSESSNIYKVVVNARVYNTDSSVTLQIGGTSNTLTSSYADYTKEYSTATNSVAIKTTANSKRAWISSVTVYTKTNEDIGQTADCVGLETFITNYMHMDYTDNLGYCNDAEHHYYETAKAAFNALNSHQRSLFTGNSAYSIEWARLSTWASFNGDSLDSNNLLSSNQNIDMIEQKNTSDLSIIIIISTVSLMSLLMGAAFIRKRKEK